MGQNQRDGVSDSRWWRGLQRHGAILQQDIEFRAGHSSCIDQSWSYNDYGSVTIEDKQKPPTSFEFEK